MSLDAKHIGHQMKLIVFMVFALFSIKSHAEEWNLVGPGVSFHDGNNGTRSEIVFKQGGADVHVIDWSEFNPAIGLEAVFPDSDGWATRAFGQLVRDSYREFGFMAGIGRSKTIFSIGSMAVDAGVLGGLWWRQSLGGFEEFRDQDGNMGRRVFTHKKLTPFILPAFYAYGQKGGLVVTIIPKMSIGGKSLSSVTTVAAQIFYRQ